jgi:hypothetical protein
LADGGPHLLSNIDASRTFAAEQRERQVKIELHKLSAMSRNQPDRMPGNGTPRA